MAVKKKKKVKKRLRRFAIGGGTTTGTTITKDNTPSGGLGQGGQGTGAPAGGVTSAPSASSAPAAGPPSASPTPASGAPGAPGGISGLSAGSAESAFKQTESNIKRGGGIGGAASIENGPISSTAPPSGYRATEVQDAVNQVNALRDVMQSQSQQFKSPFTSDMNKTVRTIAGEVGVDKFGKPGAGAGEVANVMINRDINNATPGQPKFNNDLDNLKQWEAAKAPSFKKAAPGSEVEKNVANAAIEGLMEGPQAPNAVGFRGIKQRGGKTTQTTGIDIGGQRFGNFDGVSAETMADIRGLRGLSTNPPGTPPSTVPSTENQVAVGKTNLDRALENFSKTGIASLPTKNPPVGGINTPASDDWNKVINSPYNTVFPEKAPVTGTATSFPGRPRQGANALGVPRVHSGVDFAVAPGTPVKPTVPGKVIQVAKSTSTYGPTVQVMNTYGVVDRYALHQDQNIPVKVGDTVTADTVLGKAGPLPGPDKFSHLHYERITPADPGFADIKRGMQNDTLAKNTGSVVGSTTTYSRKSPERTNFNSSTPEWAKSVGLTPGESVKIGQKLAGPAERQLAEVEKLSRPTAPKLGVASIPTSTPPTPKLRPEPLRSAAGTFTDPYNPEVQGPVRYSGSLEKIPEPVSTGYGSITRPSFTPDPRLSVPQGSFPAGTPGTVLATDPRLSLPQGSYPSATPPSAFATDPRLSLPQGSYPAGARTTVPTDPRAEMSPGSYPAAPEKAAEGLGTIMDQPGAIVGAYNGINSLIGGVNAAVQSGWNTISTPNENFKRAAETYGPAHSTLGKLAGLDKKWDSEVSKGVKPAVDSLKQTLADMQKNLNEAISNPAAQDAQRGAETVQKAEGAKMQDRLPGSDQVQSDDGRFSLSEPTEGGIVFNSAADKMTTAYSTNAPEFSGLSDVYNMGVEEEAIKEEARKRAAGEYGPDVTGDEARKLAKEAGFGPNVRYNDDFLSDPDRLGVTEGDINPEDLTPEDMAKIHSRSMANKYDDLDPNFLTKEEKETLIATKAAKQAVKQAPGAGMLMKVGEWWTEAEPVENYLGRPSYEKQTLRQMGREADVKYGRREANMPNTSGTTTGGTTTARNGSLPSEAAGGKAEVYRNWAKGIGIPSPGDPAYSEYVWWYNSSGGGGW